MSEGLDQVEVGVGGVCVVVVVVVEVVVGVWEGRCRELISP